MNEFAQNQSDYKALVDAQKPFRVAMTPALARGEPWT